jgi:AraC-like DNA-binding protein
VGTPEPIVVTTGAVDDAFGAWTYLHCRPAYLAGLVDHIWLFDGVMTSLRERTFPNGLLEIIVHLGERYSVVEERGVWVCPATCVTGVQLGHLIVEAPVRRTRVLGLRLTPAGAYALFARPMHEVASLTVDLDDVTGAAAAELAEKCDAAPTGELCVRAALAWIDARLAEATRMDAAIGWMLGQIRRRAGAVSIAQLRDQVGWSKTRLTTKFVEQVGVSPKQYARVMRFNHALRLIHGGRASFADVAVEAGYYDQPHLNAEFKQLSGFTPTELQHAHRFPNSVSVAE